MCFLHPWTPKVPVLRGNGLRFEETEEVPNVTDRQAQCAQSGETRTRAAASVAGRSSWLQPHAARSTISKEYRFPDFYETIAFVNALAYIANQEDHHPDLEVGYGKCRVSFTTHDAGGLTENDFIAAARVNALIR